MQKYKTERKRESRKHEGRKQNSFSSVRKRCQPQADGKGDIEYHSAFYSLQSTEFSPLPSSGGSK
jgi:hypothetical protein